MNETQPTVNTITRFFESFNVKTDRLATEYVSYDEENDLFLHSNAETWGDSVRLSVELKDTLSSEILSLEGYDEEILIQELATLFLEVNFDIKRFETAVQARYNTENDI